MNLTNGEDRKDLIAPLSIEGEMRASFLEYSMSVIVARAIPDARDGLKPVHRRILHAMNEKGNTYNKRYRKSANTVGETLGSYHPHGDVAIYDALARMAQDFSMRHPLIDGQGNFGSVDGDAPAAMRYTEARLARIATELLEDIDKETVDFTPNYDESKVEPEWLPAKYPNLLVNGSGGIAVGMTTNIPPHNLGEIVDGLIFLIENKDASIDQLMRFIPAPDFPTGATIYGMSGVREAYHSGRGLIQMRANAEIETFSTAGSRKRIVFTELPYQVNKARLIEKIAALVRDKKIEGISDLRDESDRSGMRIAIELKKGANEQVVLNLLYRHTQAQETFGIIMLALVDGRPRQINLKEALQIFIEHRISVITRRTIFDLRKAREKELIYIAYVKAIDNLDQVIALIRSSESPETALVALIDRFDLTEIGAKAILDMRLARLTALERAKVEAELAATREKIETLTTIRDSRARKDQIIIEEARQIKERYADARRSILVEAENEIDIEDLIPKEDVVTILTSEGYIKRVALDQFKAQRRGGVGARAMSMKDEDVAEQLFVANSHDHLLFFTNLGRAFRARVFNAPEGSKDSKGRSINNLLELRVGERVAKIFPLAGFDADSYLFLTTRLGFVKKTKLSAFANIHSGGIIAIDLVDGDEVIAAALTDGASKIALVASSGMTILFDEADVRPTGRTSRGVRGMSLAKNAGIVAMESIAPDQVESAALLSVKESGLGKRTLLSNYRAQRRGGKGLIDIKVADGALIAATQVSEADEIIILVSGGGAIRVPAREIPLIGRNSKGARIVRLPEGAKVVAARAITGEASSSDRTDQAAQADRLDPQSAEDGADRSDAE